MPEIEIGKNKDGEIAVTKKITRTPTYSVNLRSGLEDYKPIETISIPSDCQVECGEIDSKHLLQILSKQKSKIEKIEKELI